MPKEMKSHQDIHDYIVALESDFPVEMWSIGRVHVWPYLRIKIYYALIHQVEGTSTLKPERIVQKRNSLFKRWKVNFFQLLYYTKITQRSIVQSVMFATISVYRVPYEGKLFHRFFDTMIKSHQLKRKMAIIEMQGVKPNSYNSANLIDGIRLRNGYRLLKSTFYLLSKNKEFDNIYNLTNYDLFLNRLSKDIASTANLYFDKESLIMWAKKIRTNSIVYKKLFKSRNVQRFITISYYGYDDMAAALLAANDLGIESVDFQHGPQTNVHMAYNSWTKIPGSGFNTMPKVYWCWDKISRDSIRLWWKKSSGSKCVGHPWLAINQNHINTEKRCDFLYTLQLIKESNLDYFFSEHLLKLMRLNGYFWILRTHPRNTYQIDMIQEFLEVNNVPSSHYCIEHPSKSPLAVLLNACEVHITNYSGCVVEANLLKKKTIIIDKTGYLFFKDYFESNLINFLDKHQADFVDRALKIHSSKEVIEEKLNLKVYNPINGL